MSESTISQRIAQLLEHFAKGNKSAFAKAVGISNQSLGEIVGGRQNAPSFAALQKIAFAYPSIRLHWLVLGEGPMLEMTDEDPTHKLEMFASEVVDKIEEMVQSGELPSTAARLTTGYPSVSNLLKLRQIEEVERAGLVDAIEHERKEFSTTIKTEPDGSFSEGESDRLTQAEEARQAAESAYIEATRNRIRAERALLGYETSSITTVYRLGTDGDSDSIYDGLLSRRLNISNEAAERLVKDGKIRATYIEGEGYRITEQAVRIFLGEF